jgi:hypothetical protein
MLSMAFFVWLGWKIGFEVAVPLMLFEPFQFPYPLASHLAASVVDQLMSEVVLAVKGCESGLAEMLIIGAHTSVLHNWLFEPSQPSYLY